MGVMAVPWKNPAPATKAASDLPTSVDNSVSEHFPPIFNQIGNSCAQASGIGYIFTYEMNALLNRDASLPENRFSYFFTWNFINGGKNEGGFSFDGLSLGKDTGIMTESDFPRQTTESSFYWATGFDKYLNAMKYRPTEFNYIYVTDEESIEEVKQYLYNKGVEGGKGGVLGFSGYSDALQGLYSNYSGPSETGYDCMMTEYSMDGAHAMTIVGYDDTVEFVKEGQTHKGAFIVVNSYGTWWGDEGRFYLPYHFFLTDREPSVLSHEFTGCRCMEYTPQVVFCVRVSYDSRNDLAFTMGVADKPYATTPTLTLQPVIAVNQGGDHPMQGEYVDNGNTIELAFDFTEAVERYAGYSEPKYFLTVTRSELGKLGSGTLDAFSVIDMRDPSQNREYVCELFAQRICHRLRHHYRIYEI